MLPAVFKLYARQLTAPGRWVATEAIAQAFGISLPSLDMGKLNLPVQKAPCSVTVIVMLMTHHAIPAEASR